MAKRGPSKEATQWSSQNVVPIGWMKQFRYFLGLYDKIRDLDGHVVECGLGEGNTFSMLAYLIGSEDYRPPRKLFGFDSFEGWPEPDLRDKSPRNPKKGEWKVDEGMIRGRLQNSGITKQFPKLEIVLTKGFLSQSLLTFPDVPIAFLHIDVDLYEGYRDALKYLWDKVVMGGVVAFDEYKEFPNRPEYGYGKIEKWPGCTKAVDEFLQGTGLGEVLQYYHQETKKYYLIKN